MARLRLLMVSTTGEHFAYYELDEELTSGPKELPAVLQESVARIRENCEPALYTVFLWPEQVAPFAPEPRKIP